MTSSPLHSLICPLSAIALMLSACGGDSGSRPEPDGVYSLITDYGCELLFSFEPDDGTYAHSEVCELDGGDLGAETEYGKYSVSDGELLLQPNLSTCEDADLFDYTFSLKIYDNGDLLLVDGLSAAYEFERVEPRGEAGPGSTTLLGCWDDDVFTYWE